MSFPELQQPSFGNHATPAHPSTVPGGAQEPGGSFNSVFQDTQCVGIAIAAPQHHTDKYLIILFRRCDKALPCLGGRACFDSGDPPSHFLVAEEPVCVIQRHDFSFRPFPDPPASGADDAAEEAVLHGVAGNHGQIVGCCQVSHLRKAVRVAKPTRQAAKGLGFIIHQSRELFLVSG